MQKKNKQILGIVIGAIALVMVAAGASALITHDVITPEKQDVVRKSTPAANQTIHWNKPQQPAQQPVQQISAKCDDGNVVGYGLGAVAGGLVGHQLGGGKGKDVATVGGAAAGALAGGQFLPTRGILCKR